MAKSVYPQKKRITHIGKGSNGGESLDCSFDVLDIMKDMDISINSVSTSSNSELFQNNNIDYLNVPMAKESQNSAVPLSNDNFQAEKRAALKFKKLSGSRACPLMEKSKKVLKQLKHNRSLPKPRAHLSSIPPVNNYTGLKAPVFSQNKKKPKGKESVVKNKAKVSAQNSLPSQKLHSRESAAVSKPVYTVPCNAKQNSVKSLKNHKAGENDKFDTNSNHSQSKEGKKEHPNHEESEDSDDYERFIQSNKKDPEEEDSDEPKKKVLKKKRKMAKKNSKQPKKIIILETLPEQYDSNFHDSSSYDDSYPDACKKVNKVKSNLAVNSGPCNSKQNSVINLRSNKAVEKDKCESNSACLKRNKKMPNKTSKRLKRGFSSNGSSNEDEGYQDTSFTEVTKEMLNVINPTSCSATQNSAKSLETNKGLEKEDRFETDSISLSSNHSQSNESTKNELSNDDKSGSEAYERFIQSNKIELEEEVPKKIKKKVLKKKRTMPVRQSKRLRKSMPLESFPEQYDSNFHDSSSGDDGSRDACPKVTEVRSNSIGDDASEAISFQNSEEADVDSQITVANIEPISGKDNCTQTNSLLAEKSSEIETSSEHSGLASNPSLSSLSECDNSYIGQAFTKINVKDQASTKSIASNFRETKTAECVSTPFDLCNSSASKSSVQSVGCVKVNDQVPVRDAEVIDLSGSDSEPESTECAQYPKSPTQQYKESDTVLKESQNPVSTNMDSEDSDIEIVEVVSVPNRVKQVPNREQCTCGLSHLENHNAVDTSKNKMEEIDDVKQSLTSIISTVNNIAQKVVKPTLLTSIPLENTPQPTEACFEVKKEAAESNNPVYMTNICEKYENKSSSANEGPIIKKEVSEDDDIMIIESDVKCHSRSSPSNIIKKEKCEEEDDIIIDFVSIKKEPTVENTCIGPTQHANSKRQIESCSNIKSEYSASCKSPETVNIERENQPATCRVNSPDANSVIENTLPCKSVNDVRMQTLLDIYKKEFQTFQELKATEEKLESSLKFIEVQQAEKLNAIRSLIHDLVKSDPGLYKVCAASVVTNESRVPVNSSVSNIQTAFRSEGSFHSSQDVGSINLSHQISSSIPAISVKTERDENPDVSRQNLRTSIIVENSTKCKSEPSENTQTSGLFGKMCDVCGKEAVAACQRCAKAFFCSNECGKLFWNNGHDKVCGK